LKVIQLRGRYEDIGLEAREAARLDADILFIDTGDMNDIDIVAREIRKMGLREKVEIAFGGAVTLEEMDIIKTLDVDILDIGRAIVDAPLLDLKYEVQRI
jgi:nicotinate-nucleotide pyrophosphorylase (carboxylating)